MANIFKVSQDQNNQVNRNTFDLSFQNNLTLKFGTLYPVFLKEALPGSSFMIRPSFALNFMPMVFPVQTRMRAYLHFFKVRKRSLWSGFMDYYAKNKASLKDSMPYMDLSSKDVFDNVAKTGSLGDYLGIPTTIVGDYGNQVSIGADNIPISCVKSDIVALKAGSFVPVYSNSQVSLNSNVQDLLDLKPYTLPAGACIRFRYDITDFIASDFSNFVDGSFSDSLTSYFDISEDQSGFCAYLSYEDDGRETCLDVSPFEAPDVSTPFSNFNFTSLFTAANAAELLNHKKAYFTVVFEINGQAFNSNNVSIALDSQGYPTQTSELPQRYDNGLLVSSDVPLTIWRDTNEGNVKYYYTKKYEPLQISVDNIATNLSLRDLSFGDTPYFDSVNTPNGIKLCSLPFRAYEAIYNSFYRNILNDPYILDGLPEYNKFIPSDKGGSDSNVYKLHQRYWEDDFLTTAIQNPQAADFPVLVGITNIAGQGIGFSVRDEEGNNYQMKAVLSSDGKSITSFNVTDLPAEQIISNPKAFIDIAQSGISITDFRCANALQRWLEMNARKGLRFKDIVKGRFDVDIRFDELNMPEFIGGDTAEVSINQINQSVGSREGTFDDVLGSYAGQASCFKRSDNAITTFCDEPCYIIGLLSVVPVANYSQLLPKMFTKRDVLDEFSPEFAHIGYQPVPYSEVCPTQAFKDSSIKLTDPFGYQRAWYDYIASTDEVHGQFRTSLRNFLVNRVFGSRPVLSHSFLTVNNDDINDIFSVTADTDKILGQVYFDCQVKHPIPKFGIPKLEA